MVGCFKIQTDRAGTSLNTEQPESRVERKSSEFPSTALAKWDGWKVKDGRREERKEPRAKASYGPREGDTQNSNKIDKRHNPESQSTSHPVHDVALDRRHGEGCDGQTGEGIFSPKGSKSVAPAQGGAYEAELACTCTWGADKQRRIPIGRDADDAIVFGNRTRETRERIE